jgi:hypothetical protein
MMLTENNRVWSTELDFWKKVILKLTNLKAKKRVAKLRLEFRTEDRERRP